MKIDLLMLWLIATYRDGDAVSLQCVRNSDCATHSGARPAGASLWVSPQ